MTYHCYILLYFLVATDWSKCIKKRATEILEEIRNNRRITTNEAKDIYDQERRTLARRWGLLNHSSTTTITPKADDIAPGNVFFYQEE